MIRAGFLILALIVNSLAGLSFFLCPSECCTIGAAGTACCGSSEQTGNNGACGCCDDATNDPCCGGDREAPDAVKSLASCQPRFPMPPDRRGPTRPCSPEDCPLGCCIIVQTGPMLRVLESGSSLVKRASIETGPIAANPTLPAISPESHSPAVTAETRSGLPESSSRLRRARLCIRTI